MPSDNEASRGSIFSSDSDSDSDSPVSIEELVARRITVERSWNEEEGGMVEGQQKYLLEFPRYSSDEEDWLPETEDEEQPAVESAVEQSVEAEGLSWMEGEDRMEQEQPMAEPEPSEQPILPPPGQHQPSQNPAPPRETYKGVVLKINPPDPFTGSSSSDSLQDWWLLAKQYLRVCGWTVQPQPVQQAIVNSMLGRELQTTWLRMLDEDQADERTLADLYEWLKSNTLDKDRCEDMITDMERLPWSLNTIPQSCVALKKILARGVGKPNYIYPCSSVVDLVKKGLAKQNLSDRIRDIACQPNVRGELTNKAWEDTTLFLNHLLAACRSWVEEGKNLKRVLVEGGQPQPGKRQRQRQLGQHASQQQQQPTQQARPHFPAPRNLGKTPPIGQPDESAAKWCREYQAQLHAAGFKKDVCYWCKKVGHSINACYRRKAGKK